MQCDISERKEKVVRKWIIRKIYAINNKKKCTDEDDDGQLNDRR